MHTHVYTHTHTHTHTHSKSTEIIYRKFTGWRQSVLFNTKHLWWHQNFHSPSPIILFRQGLFQNLLISPVGLSGGIGFCGRTFFPFFFLPLRGGRVRAGGLVFLRGRFLTSAASSFCNCSCTTKHRKTNQLSPFWPAPLLSVFVAASSARPHETKWVPENRIQKFYQPLLQSPLLSASALYTSSVSLHLLPIKNICHPSVILCNCHSSL